MTLRRNRRANFNTPSRSEEKLGRLQVYLNKAWKRGSQVSPELIQDKRKRQADDRDSE